MCTMPSNSTTNSRGSPTTTSFHSCHSMPSVWGITSKVCLYRVWGHNATTNAPPPSLSCSPDSSPPQMLKCNQNLPPSVSNPKMVMTCFGAFSNSPFRCLIRRFQSNNLPMILTPTFWVWADASSSISASKPKSKSTSIPGIAQPCSSKPWPPRSMLTSSQPYSQTLTHTDTLTMNTSCLSITASLTSLCSFTTMPKHGCATWVIVVSIGSLVGTVCPTSPRTTSFNSVTFKVTNRVSSAWTRVVIRAVTRTVTGVAVVRTAGDSTAGNVLIIARTPPLSRVIAARTALPLPVTGALPLHVDALSAQINVAAASSLTNNVRPASELVTRLSIVTCWLLHFSLNVTKSPLRMRRATR